MRLQFVREAAWESSAIAWFSAGRLSHVDAVMGCGLLGARDDACGGVPAGVWVRPGFYRRWALRVVMEVPCTALQAAGFRDFLMLQVGKPYDWRAIWGFVSGRDWREPDSWICSELQAAALEHAGIVPGLYLAANKITPVALALAVSAMGGRVIEACGK